MGKKSKPPLRLVAGGKPDILGILGISGCERSLPKNQLNARSGELLIVGTGRCLWRDVNGLPEFKAVMAVNDAGMYWPGWLRHWYSNDIEQLVHWSKGRRRPYKVHFSEGWDLHSSSFREGAEYEQVHQWPIPSQGGSGVVAILVALLLGYDTIVTAGMPFDDDGHFFDPPTAHNLRRDRKWSNFTTETPDEIIRRYLPLFRGRVYPLSGRLKEMMDG